MCGIFCSVSRDGFVAPDQDTLKALQARGPDWCETVKTQIRHRESNSSIYLTFVSTVLALRGEVVQHQPLTDAKTGSILCWNGEAWKHDGLLLTGNDSIQVFDHLQRVDGETSGKGAELVASKLSSFAGPFAFVFYHSPSHTLFFGRDRLGRRSLVTQISSDGILTVSSISSHATDDPLKEADAATVYYIPLHDQSFEPKLTSWPMESPTCNLAIPNLTPSIKPALSTVDDLISRLTDSLRLRILNVPVHSQLQRNPDSAKIAILFSGGIDCTLLARLVHDILPMGESVDLINVAFENPRAVTASKKTPGSFFEICPDRVTGRTSFEELQRVCAGRTWLFIAVDIAYSEVLLHKTKITRLMAPHQTEMDLSIAMALYFAARGQGTVAFGGGSDTINPLYQTTARVLLSGLGADELFGGYSRHAAAFARGGYEQLNDELQLDFARIGQRNLGRDDRVLSHWGKEIRYPYLDEDFTKFALRLPVWEKCGFRHERSIPKHYEEAVRASKPEELEPAKMLLRLALWQLDMKFSASERKRAIQFGAKTAKMTLGGGRTKGTQVIDVE